jgi:pimeloyl-ACP methyl ester carboxylesterase
MILHYDAVNPTPSMEIERLALDDVQIEFARIPPARRRAPTLIFLHEGLGSLGLWRDVPAEIAARTGRGVLVYSRTGNGFSSPLRSPRTPRYMHDEALALLPTLLERLDIGDVVLIGHSDGASIALIFAAHYAARVRGVVVEAPHLFVEQRSIDGIAAAKQSFETTTLRERLARHHADVDRTFYGWNDIWLDPAFRDWSIETEVARIAAPVLAIQGASDEYGTLEQIDALARLAAGSVDRLVLAGCGHAPHRERAPLVVATIAQWIDAILE